MAEKKVSKKALVVNIWFEIFLEAFLYRMLEWFIGMVLIVNRTPCYRLVD